MATHRSGFHLHAIVPISLFCSLAILYPIWNHHTVKIESPMFARKADAEAWGPRYAAGQKCLSYTIDYRLTAIGDEARTGDPGPWYGTLRCNQPKMWWRIAAAMVFPYLIVLWIGRLLFPPDKKS